MANELQFGFGKEPEREWDHARVAKVVSGCRSCIRVCIVNVVIQATPKLEEHGRWARGVSVDLSIKVWWWDKLTFSRK